MKILAVVAMKITVFCDVTPCSLVNNNVSEELAEDDTAGMHKSRTSCHSHGA